MAVGLTPTVDTLGCGLSGEDGARWLAARSDFAVVHVARVVRLVVAGMVEEGKFRAPCGGARENRRRRLNLGGIRRSGVGLVRHDGG